MHKNNNNKRKKKKVIVDFRVPNMEEVNERQRKTSKVPGPNH